MADAAYGFSGADATFGAQGADAASRALETTVTLR